MKVRNTFYLPLELQARVDRLAKARNLSGTSIIEATIASVFPRMPITGRRRPSPVVLTR